LSESIKNLKECAEKHFSKRSSLESLWQEQAENFYCERADFTTSRNLGTDFAAHLTTSYPTLARQSLGNSFSAMLRPKATPWFKIRTQREDKEDVAAKRWLEWATELQFNAMYDRRAQFVRATKEADHDFATFGQCVISVEYDMKERRLLYRCWHLRDVAWTEGYDGKISEIYRRWKPTARELSRIFPKTISQTVKDLLDKDGHKEVEVYHIVVPSDVYQGEKKWNTPYVSIFIERDSDHVLEEVGSHTQRYVIPRWQTVSGSQYAYSPATVAALPDARLIQAMTLVLLEAGQKAVDPPMIAVQDVVRSDVSLFSSGITWVDADYDERLGEALRPVSLDTRGLPLGIELRQDIKGMIQEAFFLNKISMPPVTSKEMTAYEVAQRIQQYIRDALPLFEPMEMEYNGAICEMTFDTLMMNGGFGNLRKIPESLLGNEIKWQFESPLHSAIEEQKGELFFQTRRLIDVALPLDQKAVGEINIRRALRDALDGIGTPAEWKTTEEERQAFDQEFERKAKAHEMLALAQQGGAAAEQIGNAGKAINEMAGGGA